MVGSGKLDLNFVNEGKIFESTNWDNIKKSQPFFLQVNTPEAEYDIYDFRTNRPERIKWWGEEEHVQYAKPDSRWFLRPTSPSTKLPMRNGLDT